MSDPATDRALLDRFVDERDEKAFSELVLRHGPLVMGVCRRVLGNATDAEDAFQATFIVLSKKAASIRRLDSISSWLHGVAVRISLKARSMAGNRRAHERRLAEMTPSLTPEVRETLPQLRPILDQELNELPSKYRDPLVLCYLEGKTNEGAAKSIGCPIGTMSRRLDKARELLRGRLVGRGVAVSGATLGLLLAEKAAFAAAVPPALAASAAKVAVLAAAGEAAVSASVALLVKGALKSLVAAQMKVAAAALLSVGLLGSAAGVVTYRALTSEAEDPSVASDLARLDRRLTELQPLPSERRVDEIGWSPDLMSARRLSQASGRPVFLVQHDGDLFTGRCDGGTHGMRTGPLNDDRIIALLNRGFVPVALSNEDLAPTGRATPADKDERTRIYQGAIASKFSAGDGCMYVVAPDGKVLASVTVPRASSASNVVPLLEQFRGPEGAPLVNPVRQSRAPAHRPDDLVLHLVARYVDTGGGLEKDRTTYHEFPAENWLVLPRSEGKRLLPAEAPRVGLEWTPAPDLAAKLLTHFYPVTHDCLRDDAARSKVERTTLRARVLSLRDGIVRARLEGDVRLSRYFYDAPPPTHRPEFLEAKVLGFLDFEPSGRIVSLKMTTEGAHYGPAPFAVALQSK
ncbi:MAG TPA: sigma-70 family RNA polymerase sigma factor [Planctomycetota bacterium]|nr:sigma-70 family RNA polymerase sigma factor [Planctomycetota bacterium]